ncbi:CPBP family intramembrane glutamic endopeptidase [Tumebacillus permanentifrigoris]|uniref:CAAX prenyl protease-like protein n=1 Tax=Tumebacillus permanentifrigoris TaxID=378543 RepID=A0A316DBM2_9BACL|nr:type II CAAX endopeptidase family protein [Tumebacillus permanentifrigoris]PWK15537.1 CAAX prenyl protease-like protein [Tumebacillus permanentifrigoris]
MNRGRVWARRVQVTGAVLLCGGYLQDVLLTLQSLTLRRDTHGTWQVLSDPTSISRNWTLAAFFMIIVGLVAFATGYLLRRRGAEPASINRLTWRHLCLALGWVGLLFFGGMYAFYFGLGALVPSALRQSAGLAALGSVSMQIAAIIAIPLYYRRATHEIGLNRPVLTWRIVGYVLMFFIAIFAVSLLTHSLGNWFGINTNSYREQNISSELHTAWWQGNLFLKLLPILASSLIAPIGEELMFRGAVQSTVTTKWGPLAGLLLSSLLFALVHADVVLFLPIFVMGLLFGILRWVTGSLWAPIWLHALNNFYASFLDLL